MPAAAFVNLKRKSMSIYKQYLGKDFDRLHPMMQQRFGISSDRPVYMLGTGVMERVRNAGWHTLPFLYLGTFRNIMFPETVRTYRSLLRIMRTAIPSAVRR